VAIVDGREHKLEDASQQVVIDVRSSKEWEMRPYGPSEVVNLYLHALLEALYQGVSVQLVEEATDGSLDCRKAAMPRTPLLFCSEGLDDEASLTSREFVSGSPIGT